MRDLEATNRGLFEDCTDVGMDLFICGSLRDSLSGSEHTESNDGIMCVDWIGKDMEGNGQGLIWGTNIEFTLRHWRKNEKKTE
jgi:hypothetical protein